MNQKSVRPVVALMGEFSAGKSTLANLLIGRKMSQVKVTATQMPPIWYSSCAEASYLVDRVGSVVPIVDGQDQNFQLQHVSYVKMYVQSDALKDFDIIDMPGISDPSLSEDSWLRLMDAVDAVVWCTHATQAWRQSEAATWSRFSDRFPETSILLVTRFDKILGERDRQRLLARIRRDVHGLFREVYPASLTRAGTGSRDPALWEESGMGAFNSALISVTSSIFPGSGREERVIRNMRSGFREGSRLRSSSERPEHIRGTGVGQVVSNYATLDRSF